MRLRNVACGAVALVIALAPLQGASAHAAYKSSDPPDNGKVGSPPSRVTAEYTEPLAGGSYLQVTDPCGDRVDGGDVSITGYTMSVSMSGDVAGRYVVSWRAHSQLDPHVTTGEFEFSAASGGRCAGSAPDPGPGSGSGGGGGAGSGNGAGSGSGGGDTAAAGTAAAGTSTAGSSGSGGTRQSANNGGGSRNGGASSSRRERSGFQPKKATVPNIAAPEEREDAEEPSVWDGIRLEPFLTGLLLAAIIGAAGGKIYAGIMGPRA